MTSRAGRSLVLVLAVLAAWVTGCGGDARPARERVLARIPADVMAVVAASAPTLADPRLRAVVDVLRPRWPARLSCALDAVLAAEHAALGVTAARSGVLVLETRREPTCPALSRIADRTYV